MYWSDCGYSFGIVLCNLITFSLSLLNPVFRLLNTYICSSQCMEPQKQINHLSISIFAITRLRTILTIYRTYFLIRDRVSQMLWTDCYSNWKHMWYHTATLDANHVNHVLHHKEKEKDAPWKWRPDYNGRSLGRLIHQFSSLAYFNITDIKVKHCEEHMSNAARTRW